MKKTLEKIARKINKTHWTPSHSLSWFPTQASTFVHILISTILTRAARKNTTSFTQVRDMSLQVAANDRHNARPRSAPRAKGPSLRGKCGVTKPAAKETRLYSIYSCEMHSLRRKRNKQTRRKTKKHVTKREAIFMPVFICYRRRHLPVLSLPSLKSLSRLSPSSHLFHRPNGTRRTHLPRNTDSISFPVNHPKPEKNTRGILNTREILDATSRTAYTCLAS